MKRSERHHLKENTLAASIARLQQTAETRGRQFVVVGLLLVIVIASVVGYFAWRQRIGAQGAEMLADAMTTAAAVVVPPAPPPDPDNPEAVRPAEAFQPGSYTSVERRAEAALRKFLDTADAHPTSPAGVTARYHAAATLARLERRDEAQAQYQIVIDAAGESIYGRMATLGLAETQMHAGQYDAAIELFKSTMDLIDSQIPLDGILMQLGRAYLLAGQTTEAQDTFTRIVAEFPNSVYQPRAQAELDKLEPPGVPSP